MTAACSGMEPGIFFSDEPEYDPRLALRTCRECPIQSFCLATYLANEGKASHENRFGIAGGMTPEERASLARRDSRGSMFSRMRSSRDLKLFEVWDSGYSDEDAAEYLQMTLKAWRGWRERRGLPANKDSEVSV